jgi:hypothetical protein
VGNSKKNAMIKAFAAPEDSTKRVIANRAHGEGVSIRSTRRPEKFSEEECSPGNSLDLRFI